MDSVAMVLLTIILITANDKKNAFIQVEVQSVTECLEQAKKYLESSVPEGIEYQGREIRCNVRKGAEGAAP